MDRLAIDIVRSPLLIPDAPDVSTDACHLELDLTRTGCSARPNVPYVMIPVSLETGSHQSDPNLNLLTSANNIRAPPPIRVAIKLIH